MSDKTNVFIIEENLSDAQIIENILGIREENTYNGESVGTLKEALIRIHTLTFHPNVILLNLNLPDSKGINTLKRIINVSGKIPVIIIYDTEDQKIYEETIQYGVRDFLLKSELTSSLLKRVIRYAIEIKSAENILEDSLDLNKKILDATTSGILVYELKGQCIYANSCASVILNIPHNQLLQQNFHLNQSWKSAGLYETFKEVLMNGKLCHKDIHFVTTSGKEVWLNCDITVFKRGSVLNLMLMFNDITDRKLAEAALAWEKYLLNSLLDSHPDSIYFKDENSKFIRISRAGALKCGVNDPSKIIGKTDFDLFANEHASLSYDYEKMIIKTGMPMINMEEKESFLDKHSSWALTTKLPLRNTSGNIIGTFGISRDITERKQAEEALTDSRTRYKSLFDDSPTPMWEEDFSDVKKELEKLKKTGIADFFAFFEDHPEKVKELTRKMKVLNINKAVLKLHHANKKEDILNDFTVVFTEETYKTMGYELAMIANGERLFDFNQEVITLDFDRRNVILRWSVAEGYEKSLSRVLISIVDITENKRVEEALRENESQLKDAITAMKKVEKELHLYHEYLEEMIKVRTEELEGTKQKNELILNSVGDGIFGMDNDGRVTFINPAAAKMIGWEIDEILGQRQHLLIHHSFSDGSVYNSEDCPIHLTIRNGDPHHVLNEVFWRKDNTNFPVEYISTPIWENGKLVGAVVVFSDITERKRSEKNLEEAKEAAEAATKAKSEFLANMSHEIRTPMNSIIGFSDILAMGVKDEKQKVQVNSIRSSARSLLTIINDILDLSKIEAGKLRISYEPVNLGHLINDVENIFSPRLNEKALQFIVEPKTQLLNNIIIDEIRLRQILLNLIGNAIKFTENGFVKLLIHQEIHSNDANKLDLHIIIQDSGIGIKKEQHKKIFESFNQQSGQSNRKYGGTGLGLTITKRLVEMMCGTISVFSEEGKGSTFEVVFPGIAVSNEIIEHVEDSDKDLLSIQFEKATVLICDDNDADRSVVSSMLEYFPFKIIEAIDHKSTMSLAEEHLPDLILMDLKLPEMNGIEIAKQIKSIPALGNIPIILISTSAKLPQIREGNQEIFNDFLMKPMHMVEIIASLKKFISFKINQNTVYEIFKLPETIVLSDVQNHNLSTLFESLESEILPLYTEIMQNQKMTLIEDFGKKLISIGKKNSFPVFMDFGDQVCKHVEIFDIEKLLNILKMFPALIAKYK